MQGIEQRQAGSEADGGVGGNPSVSRSFLSTWMETQTNDDFGVFSNRSAEC